MAGPPQDKLRLIAPPTDGGGDDAVVHVGKESDFGVDFYRWPTLSDPLPDDIVDTVKANRDALTLPKLGPVPMAKDKKTGKVTAQGGYSYGGKKYPVANPFPDDVTDEDQRAVLRRFHDHEIKGEGGTSAVMTGDTAKFTWGSGLAHGKAPKGGTLEGWAGLMLAGPNGPDIRKQMLDHGIALEGKVWKIVDTDGKTIKSDEAAIDFINGKDAEGSDTKQRILAAFAKIADDHGADAAKAQWDYLVKQYFPGAVKAGVIGTWSPEAVCYVMHCEMWGKFAGWAEFKRTGGDLRRILRLEVDYTGFYDNQGTHLEVQGVRGPVYPSGTMLLNMGAGCMLGVLEKYDGTPRSGDIVFNMHGGKSGPYVLRGVGTMYDPLQKKRDKINEDIASHQHYAMSALLAYFKSVKSKGYTNLKEMRDWYASPDNKPCQRWGVRPLVAMDAVLHAGEGEPSRWILDEARLAGISETSCWDQLAAIKKTVGLA